MVKNYSVCKALVKKDKLRSVLQICSYIERVEHNLVLRRLFWVYAICKCWIVDFFLHNALTTSPQMRPFILGKLSSAINKLSINP